MLGVDVAMRQSGRVIGIGYATHRKTTGLCLMSWNESSVEATFRNIPFEYKPQRDAIYELVGDGRNVCCAALDAPIRGSLDIIGEYRDAEMILTRKIKGYIGKPAQASSGNGVKLNQSANAFAELLLELELVENATHRARIHEACIVEAFPTSFLGVLLPRSAIPKTVARSDMYFEHLLGPDITQPVPLTRNAIAGLIWKLLPKRELRVNLGSIIDHKVSGHHLSIVVYHC
jgi:hypothetical protein